jgi:ABC-2 type transport system permease protein
MTGDNHGQRRTLGICRVNLAIWKKAVAETSVSLALCGTLLLLFAWVFVWLMSLLETGAWASLLKLMPGFFQPMLGLPLAELATPAGQISFIYQHVVTVLLAVGWALGRGSASISGEIGRGTMDLILSLPVRRASVVLIPAVVATGGAAILAAAVLAGIWLGLLTTNPAADLSAWKFLPGSVNLFCLVFCCTGITTFVSSWNRDRWRTVALAGGFYVVSVIIKMIGRLWPPGDWLKYCTFLTAYRPQEMILLPDESGLPAWQHNLTLIALGLVCYTAGTIVLARRDIPAAR